MKRNLIVIVTFLIALSLSWVVMAQTPAKPADKPTAPAAGAPVAEKPKVEKKEASQMGKAWGTVAAYEAGKVIKVKGKDKESSYDLTADTKIQGEIKEGVRVTVMYKKDGNKMVATAITVSAEKQVEGKKPAPAEKKN